MERVEKVAVLDNEVEAQVLEGMLAEQNIPHVLQCYHDSALDGLFQAGKGWGHVEAPRNFHEQIRRMIAEIRRQSRTSDAEGTDRMPNANE